MKPVWKRILLGLSFPILFISIFIVTISAGYPFIPKPSQQNFNSCIRVSDAGRQLSGQRAIRFYNNCGVDLYINVCLVNSDKSTKLYRSGRTVPGNGNFTIMNDPFLDTKKMDWVAALSPPPIPDACMVVRR